MTGPDDDFERRLRAVLHSRRLHVTADPDALERIHAGARRRQRRQRIATSGVAALAVIGLAVGAVMVRPAHHKAVTADRGGTSRLTTPATTTARSESPSLPFNSARLVPPEKSAVPVATAATIPAGGTPPKGFVPISVTAVNEKTYWVLGHAPCKTGTCTALAKTTDAGKTFTEVGAPPSALVPDNPGNTDVFGVGTISDIRFVDSDNGWAYGGGLWETTDGGQHWVPVAIDGPVEQFAVASKHAWAIVLGADASHNGPTYSLYSSMYPGGSWQKVADAGMFGPAEPLLAVHDTNVTVLGTQINGRGAVSVGSTDGNSFGVLSSNPPCASAPGGPLSPWVNGLWLACTSATNATGGVYFSSDFGSTWQVAVPTLTADRVVIGAVDEKSAILGANGTLKRVNSDGSSAVVSMPKVPDTTNWSFIGFTDAKVGFAVAIVDGNRALWRTSDGGAHWSVVKF